MNTRSKSKNSSITSGNNIPSTSQSNDNQILANLSKLSDLKACNFCFSNKTDDKVLGELRFFENIAAHKFCLHYSTELPKNGNPMDIFWGFKLPDIVNELKRGESLKCSYCDKMGALIACYHNDCEIKFHLPCGLKKGSLNEYNEENGLYQSFCKVHIPTELPKNAVCTLCHENCQNTDQNDLIQAPCCKSYFHLECTSELVKHTKYFLKCPNCRNEKAFGKKVRSIPGFNEIGPHLSETLDSDFGPISDPDFVVTSDSESSSDVESRPYLNVGPDFNINLLFNFVHDPAYPNVNTVSFSPHRETDVYQALSFDPNLEYDGTVIIEPETGCNLNADSGPNFNLDVGFDLF